MADYRVGDGYRQRAYVWTPPARRFIGTRFAYAAITGTITASVNESDIVAGGKTIIITLTGDTWVSAGPTFDGERLNIIQGLDSAQGEANGWNAKVRDLEVAGAVVRTSDTVVTITLSASAAYDITAQETITVTVPASAVNFATAIVATPTFTVSVVGGAQGRPLVNAGLSNRGLVMAGLVN